MKPPIIILFISILLHISGALAQVKFLQSSSDLHFDNGTGIIFGDSIFFAYDPVPQKTAPSYEWTWVNTISDWVMNYRWIDREYDANGNNTYYLLQFGNIVNGWVNQSRSYSTFDTYGHVLTNIQDDWFGGAWHPSINYAATYNAEGKKVFESWETIRYTYTYDAQGFLTETFKEMLGTDSLWAPDSKTIFTYQDNGKTEIGTEYVFVWNAWVERMKTTRTFDGAGNLLESLIQRWDNGIWTDYTLSTYQYDAFGNLTNDSWQLWEGGVIKEKDRRKLTYDNGYHPLEILSENFNGSDWHKSRLQRFYYTENTASSEPEEVKCRIYPNPSTDHFTLTGEDMSRAEIFSPEGRLLQSISLGSSDTETLRLDLPTGTYVLRVSDTQGRSGSKVLVIKR